GGRKNPPRFSALRRQLRQIAIQVEGLRIGEGVAVLDLESVDHRAYGELADFPADGPGDIRHRDDLTRNVSGARTLSKATADALARVMSVGPPHAAERPDARDLSRSLAERCAAPVEDLHRDPEPTRLELPAPHRQRRVADRETGDDLGTAADVGQVHVRLDRAIDIVIAVPGERTASGEDGAEPREVVR